MAPSQNDTQVPGRAKGWEKSREHGWEGRLERRQQLRGLLVLALFTLLFILWRAAPLQLFHRGWWRL